MPHRKLKVAAEGMLDAYRNLLDARGYIADAAQMTAAHALAGPVHQSALFQG
jgi:cell division protein ZapE